MNRLIKTAALLGALCASAGAWANVITFSGLDESRGTGWTPPYLPIVYQGFEIDPTAAVRSTAGVAGAVGPQAIYPSWSTDLYVRSTQAFVLNAVNVAPLIGQLGSDFDVGITAYSHGVQVAQAAVVLDPQNSGYQWVSLGGYAGFDQPIDTLLFSALNSTSQAHGFFVDALNISPIPEPETWALMGLGAVGLLARRRSDARRSDTRSKQRAA